MQINRAELQKVRVKLSRDALTIQKEGGGTVSPSSSPVNKPEVGKYSLIDSFLLLSRFTAQFSWIHCKFCYTPDKNRFHWSLQGQSVICEACSTFASIILSFKPVQFFIDICRCSAFISPNRKNKIFQFMQSPVSRGGAVCRNSKISF